MSTLTKADQKQVDRATATGNADYIGTTLAIIARQGSAKTYKAVCELIELKHDFRDFTMVNGALLHKSELA